MSVVLRPRVHSQAVGTPRSAPSLPEHCPCGASPWGRGSSGCVGGWAAAGCRQALEAGAGRGRGGIGRDVVEVGAPTDMRAADAAPMKIHARRARQGDAHDGVVDGHELVQRRVADGAEGRVGGMEQERSVRVQKRRADGRKEEPTAKALRDGAERAPGLGGGDAGQLSSHFQRVQRSLLGTAGVRGQCGACAAFISSGRSRAERAL